MARIGVSTRPERVPRLGHRSAISNRRPRVLTTIPLPSNDTGTRASPPPLEISQIVSTHVSWRHDHRSTGARPVGRARRALAAIVPVSTAAVALTITTIAPSTHADGTVVRGYATPSVSGSSDDWTGSIAPPTSPIGFPSATLTSNARTLSTASSATLTGSTPFGEVFGTSSGKTYLTVQNTTGLGTTVTTITFAAPTPAPGGNTTTSNGWGFALGDIDADKVTLSAKDASGNAISGAALGFQGVFNYVSGQTDVPTWDESTATLTGSGSDTSGASGWFRPTVPITELRLEFTALSGGPLFQIWIAAIADRSISGTATTCVDGAVVPDEGATVTLLDADSNPVISGGSPVTATTGADGTFSFTGLMPASYHVGLGGETSTADVSSANVTGIELGCTTPPTTTTSTTTTTIAPVPTTTTPAPTTTTPAPTTTTPAPVPPVPPAPPDIAIDIVNPPSGDSTVVAGGSIIASVEGCVPPEVVTFTLGTQRLGGICRDCDELRAPTGCCTVELQAPTTPGTYTIEAVFTESRPTDVLRSQTITVVDAPAPTTTTMPAPTTTKPGGGLPAVGQNTEQMSATPILLIATGLLGVLIATRRRRHV